MGATAVKPGMSGLLKKLLAKRLKGDLDQPTLPLIVENRALSPRIVHLVVIWDAWRRFSNVQRSSVITDAYALAHPKSPAPAVAMGFTPSEALSLGYLPFRVVALMRGSDKVSGAKLKSALETAGGVKVRIGDELELRFATQAQAASAYRSLQAELPSPVWTLIEERSVSESA